MDKKTSVFKCAWKEARVGSKGVPRGRFCYSDEFFDTWWVAIWNVWREISVHTRDLGLSSRDS